MNIKTTITLIIGLTLILTFTACNQNSNSAPNPRVTMPSQAYIGLWKDGGENPNALTILEITDSTILFEIDMPGKMEAVGTAILDDNRIVYTTNFMTTGEIEFFREKEIAFSVYDWDTNTWTYYGFRIRQETYDFEDGKITAYNGVKTRLINPKQINGQTVTDIAENVFNSRGMTSVTLPNTIAKISYAAFYINQLTDITLPYSVTEIGAGAFQSNQLTSVTIPNSVTLIDGGAFANNQLTSVVIPNSITTIFNFTFANNQLTSVTIPNSVSIIGIEAFYENKLTGVAIPNSVKWIGRGAFLYNPLTSITIGANVELQPYAFHIDFDNAYNKGGKLAGTYTLRKGVWTRK